MRLRAGASSSTISTRSGCPGHAREFAFIYGMTMCTWYVSVARPRSQARLRVEVEREPLADVGERHLVAGVVVAARRGTGCAARTCTSLARAVDVDA